MPMKYSPLSIIAIKMIIFSISGLCTLPFLAIIAQYIDSVTGFSKGQGYHTESSVYIFETPLVYILLILCINIILGIVFLIYGYIKEKRGGAVWKK